MGLVRTEVGSGSVCEGLDLAPSRDASVPGVPGVSLPGWGWESKPSKVWLPGLGGGPRDVS